MIDRVDKKENAQLNTEDMNRKQFGKKLFLWSILTLFLSFAAKTLFAGVLILLEQKGFNTVVNPQDNIFSNFLILIFFISLIASLVGSAFWIGNNKKNQQHKTTGGMSILDPRNPAGPNYIYRFTNRR